MTTTNEQWAPLEIGNDEMKTFTVLREDVPDYLYRSLWLWIWDRFTTSKTTLGDRYFDVDLARTCERVLRISIADLGVYDDNSFRAVRQAVEQGAPIVVWRLVDFLASRLTPRGSEADQLTQLDTMLVQAGSAWQVGQRQDKPGLVRRVPEGVGAAAQAVFQKPNAGARLRVAWEQAFGVSPDPTQAYSMAIKAVEDAAIRVVCPNDSSATLGKVIGQINAGSWKLPHLREDATAPTHDVLVGMLKTLWVGQHDRHGGPSTVGAPAVTQDEAESAVILAVTLVGWFESGHVQQ